MNLAKLKNILTGTDDVLQLKSYTKEETIALFDKEVELRSPLEIVTHALEEINEFIVAFQRFSKLYPTSQMYERMNDVTIGFVEEMIDCQNAIRKLNALYHFNIEIHDTPEYYCDYEPDEIVDDLFCASKMITKFVRGSVTEECVISHLLVIEEHIENLQELFHVNQDDMRRIQNAKLMKFENTLNNLETQRRLETCGAQAVNILETECKGDR